MKELNQFRLLAGIPIDGKIEVTEKPPVTESVQLVEAAGSSVLNDFWVVQKVNSPETNLSSVIQRTNTKGLCHLIQQGGRDFEEDLMLFAGSAKAAATKEAKKRIRMAQKQKVEAEEEAMYKETEVAAVEQEEEDWDHDYSPETGGTSTCPECGSTEVGGGMTKQSSNDRVMAQFPECDDCGHRGDWSGPDQELARSRYGHPSKLDEGITTVVAPDSWEDDEDDAVNVVTGNGKTTAPFKDIEVVKPDPKSTDSDRKNDKDESPQQLHALDTKSPQDQSDGNDLEAKCPCPAKIKNLLKTEADEARAKAKKLSVTDREDSYFYDDLARAFDDLYNHLDGGTVYDIKKAQIFMTSLMSPMMNKIPADVVNWIAKGGQQRSLKSYMQAVPDKYPITGPRNAL